MIVMERLGEVMRECFANKELLVDRSTTSADVQGWDSITHVRLLLMVEAAFHVRFGISSEKAKKTSARLPMLFAKIGYQMTKKSFVAFGLCFAPELVYLLKLSEEFAAQYETATYWIKAEHTLAEDFNISEKAKQEADVVIFQPSEWLDASYTTEYEIFLASLPKTAQVITYPYPTFPALWPFHGQDGRWRFSQDEFLSALLYIYSDTQIMRMREEGSSPSDILKAYRNIDIPSIIDVDRMLEQSLEQTAELEKKTDIKVVDFIASRFRDERIFSCVNHGSNRLLIHFVDQILDKLGMKPLSRYAHLALKDLMLPIVPIHPSLIAHFGLSYMTDQTRCQIDRRQNLRWDEWVVRLAT